MCERVLASLGYVWKGAEPRFTLARVGDVILKTQIAFFAQSPAHVEVGGVSHSVVVDSGE
jgi:hypothetical protein